MRPLVRDGGERQREYVAKRATRNMSPAERIKLHAKVDSNGCWIWQLSTPAPGYGRITINGKSGLYAHRVAYEAFVGPIPDGLELDHLCRVRACCNPAHLEPVTPQVNNRRGMAPGAVALRREMCLFGEHAYAEHGVVWGGRRSCRQCRIDYMRLWRALPSSVREARKANGQVVVDLGAYYASRRQDVAA